MNAEEAIRFLAHEAAWCRERDEHESFCLLLPALTRALELLSMEGGEAAAFRAKLKASLTDPVFRTVSGYHLRESCPVMFRSICPDLA